MIETIRDWVVIYAGVLWMLVTIVVAAIFGGLWIGSSMGLGAVNKAITEKVRPALDAGHTRLAALRDQTSRLPGNTPLPDATVAPSKGRRKFSVPFRRKRRRFPLLGRG